MIFIYIFIAIVIFLWLMVIIENLRYLVWQTAINLSFYLTHIKKIKYAKIRLKSLKNNKWDLDEIDVYLRNFFQYTSEKTDWRPWMICLCARWNPVILKLEDDCDGYAAFAKWAAKKAGYKAQFWSVIKKGSWGHAVCIIEVAKGDKYIADTKGTRKFISWKVNFPDANKFIKRWY